MKPFGPVDNGAQHLYGLDYRMAAWRERRREPVPHRGRLLALGRATRRGHALLHGAARLDDPRRRHRRSPATRSFFVEANCRRRGLRHPVEQVPRREGAHVEVHVHGARSTTTTPGRTTRPRSYHHAIGGEIAHTDRNTLRRVADARAVRRARWRVVEREQLERGAARLQLLEEAAAPSRPGPGRPRARRRGGRAGTTVTPSASPTIQSPAATSTSPTSRRAADRGPAPAWSRRAARSSSRTPGSRALRARRRRGHRRRSRGRAMPRASAPVVSTSPQ